MSGEAPARETGDVEMHSTVDEELAGRMRGLLAASGTPTTGPAPARFLNFETEDEILGTTPAATMAHHSNAPPAVEQAPLTANTAAEIRLKELELQVLRAQLELQRARGSDGPSSIAPMRITPKDVNLEKFYGHSDRNA